MINYEGKIAIRFLLYTKWQSFFIIIAIAFGVVVQIFISSLIVSLQDNLINKILGNAPHIEIISKNSRNEKFMNNLNEVYISGNKYKNTNEIFEFEKIISNLKNNKNIKNIVKTFVGSALYIRKGENKGINIKGINLNEGDKIYNIKNRVYLGSNNIFDNNILVGKRFLENNDLYLNDNINLIFGENLIEKFKIIGVFDLETKNFNENLIIMDINTVQRIYKKKNKINKIDIQINNIFAGNKLVEKYNKYFENIEAISWTRDGQGLENALRAQTNSSRVIQGTVILGTIMSITSILTVTVLQKRKQIGILKALGGRNKSIGLIFLIEGGILGLLGSLVGIILGITLIILYMKFGKPSFHIKIETYKIFYIIILGTVTGIVGAIFPLIKCFKINPLEVIKNG